MVCIIMFRNGRGRSVATGTHTMFALAAATPATPAPAVYFASAAREHLASTYTPAWEQLFLREDSSDDYPMPRASEVIDLLTPVRTLSNTQPCKATAPG